MNAKTYPNKINGSLVRGYVESIDFARTLIEEGKPETADDVLALVQFHLSALATDLDHGKVRTR